MGSLEQDITWLHTGEACLHLSRHSMQVKMNLLSPSLLLSTLTAIVAEKLNCGFNCYRWAKCMGQLDGSNRPGQLGDTGIIVLNTCSPMEGKCNCAALVLDSLSVSTETPKRKSKFTPKRTPRRKGMKFSEVEPAKYAKDEKGSESKPAKYEKEEKKSLIKSKSKYKRFQKKRFHKDKILDEASTEKTIPEKPETVRRSKNRRRKFRMRKRI